MITGKCLACGRTYYGWGLIDPGPHFCARCGSRLEVIIDKGRTIDDGDLTAFEKYLLRLPRPPQNAHEPTRRYLRTQHLVSRPLGGRPHHYALAVSRGSHQQTAHPAHSANLPASLSTTGLSPTAWREPLRTNNGSGLFSRVAGGVDRPASVAGLVSTRSVTTPAKLRSVRS